MERDFDVGADAERCGFRFCFTGALDELTLTVGRPQLTPEDERKPIEAQRDDEASE